jgi:hypothetical protein
MVPSGYNYLHPCYSEIQTRSLDVITLHDFREVQFFLTHFRILDYLLHLFQYFMTSVKGYLETNWGWYSSTCRHLRNEKDSKPYIPGFIIVVLALFSYWHSDLPAEDKFLGSSELFIVTFKDYCHSQYRKNLAEVSSQAIFLQSHILGFVQFKRTQLIVHSNFVRLIDFRSAILWLDISLLVRWNIYHRAVIRSFVHL